MSASAPLPENPSDPYVFGVLLDGAGGGEMLARPEDGAEELGRSAGTWLHFDYSVAGAFDRLVGLGLAPELVESLTRLETRPRTLVLPDGVLAVMRGINTNPGNDPEDMVSLRFWLTRDRVVTVRQRRLLAVQDTRIALVEGRGPESLPQVLAQVVERLTDRVSVFVDDLEDRLVDLETRAETENATRLRTDVTALRRSMATVRRFLAPQREALEALHRQAGTWLPDDVRFDLREQADRLMRYVEDLDLVRERAQVLQEELQNRVASEQNARMYLLSVVTAVFLPITFVTGLFGMNVGGLPGTESPVGFAVVVGAMVALSGLVVVLLRRNRWL